MLRPLHLLVVEMESHGWLLPGTVVHDSEMHALGGSRQDGLDTVAEILSQGERIGVVGAQGHKAVSLAQERGHLIALQEVPGTSSALEQGFIGKHLVDVIMEKVRT